MKNRNFITTQEWTKEDIESILKLADDLKKEPYNNNLKNKSLYMVFFNPSLRTRSSFETAMSQNGGTSVNLSVGQDTWKLEHRIGAVMDGSASEHIKDASKVLSRYGNGIAVRCFPGMEDWNKDKEDPVIRGFEKYATVPVINMESSLYHPCQALADMMTIKENLENPKKKKLVLAWCYHPKPLPMSVPNSAALITSKFGMDVTIACPKGFELSEDIIKNVNSNCDQEGGNLDIVHDLNYAVDDADIVYAKSWGSLNYYGKWKDESKIRNSLMDWKITRSMMDNTGDGKFMHCLPVRRNVVVDDEVIDGEQSVVYDQAENRLHAQKALLNLLLGDA